MVMDKMISEDQCKLLMDLAKVSECVVGKRRTGRKRRRRMGRRRRRRRKRRSRRRRRKSRNSLF